MTRIDPVTDLSPQALGEIRDALVRGYDHDSLDQLLLFNWGLWVSEEFDENSGFRSLVTDLIKYADKKGRLLDLLALAYANNPGNPKLEAAAQRYLDEPNAALVQYGSDVPPPLVHSLEGLVNSRSRLFKFGEFLTRLKALGSRICRVEVPSGGGTAWLVGRWHVLTNYHVMLPVLSGQTNVEQVVCRFDVWSEDGSAPPRDGIVVQVESVVEKRSYSQSDLAGRGNPTEDELDYALLKLKEPAGAGRCNGGDERGWFAFGSDPPIIARGDIAMIPQHASGRPLEVAYGTVVELPATGLRYRYDVTTEPGSSGSPVLTPDLYVFGLHHAAEPQLQPKYNQAVPLWRVARDLEAKQIDWVS